HKKVLQKPFFSLKLPLLKRIHSFHRSANLLVVIALY
ncbi:MAG: hypothetical protein ACI9LN_004273, partial [Saprospiraceae bacterium]